MTPTEKKEQMKLLHEIGGLPTTEQTELLMTIRNKCREYKIAHGSPKKKMMLTKNSKKTMWVRETRK